MEPSVSAWIDNIREGLTAFPNCILSISLLKNTHNIQKLKRIFVLYALFMYICTINFNHYVISTTMTSSVYQHSAQGFGALAAGFVVQALGEIIPWLCVMTAIVFADLIAGLARSLKEKRSIRFSRAVRETLSKFCTYFAVVVCFAFYDVASDSHSYAEGACFLVMVIEAVSIGSNILKYHGYDLNFNKLFAAILSKKFAIDDSEGIITKSEENTKQNGN